MIDPVPHRRYGSGLMYSKVESAEAIRLTLTSL